jgi:hypothetical protein
VGVVLLYEVTDPVRATCTCQIASEASLDSTYDTQEFEWSPSANHRVSRIRISQER